MAFNNYSAERLPLNWYKENVNLVEYAIDMYGFKINYDRMPKFSSNTPKWVVLEDKNGDNFIFSRNYQNNDTSQSHYYYINTLGSSRDPIFGNNREDRGSIFDFIMFRDGIDIKGAIANIKHYLKDVKPNIKNRDDININPTQRTSLGANLMPHYAINAIDNSKPEKGVLNFLTLREIPSEILKNNKFDKQICFRNYENSYGYLNTDLCFPIFSLKENMNIGFFTVNQYDAQHSSFKQILGYKNDGLWFSNFNKLQQLDKLIITESPLDAISHYYLNPNLQDKNILYCATIGTPSSSQIPTLDYIIEKYNPKEISLACDRDQAGQKFNLFIASHIKLKNPELDNIQVYFSNGNDNVGEFLFNFKYSSIEANNRAIDSIKNFFDKANEKLTNNDIEKKAFNLNINTLSEDVISVKADFFSTYQNWNTLTQVVVDSKFTESMNVKIDIPVNKDFNDDIKMANLAYKAEKVELQYVNASVIPSFSEFLKENYKMDGSNPSVFINSDKKSDISNNNKKEEISAINTLINKDIPKNRMSI